LALVLLLLVATLFSGCAHVGTEEGAEFIIATSEAFSRFKGEYENTSYFKRHKPASVAVLPFAGVEDKSYSIAYSKENPGDIVRRGMYNHIASLPFKDLEIYNTDKRLKNAGLTKPLKSTNCWLKTRRNSGVSLGSMRPLPGRFPISTVSTPASIPRSQLAAK